MAESRTQANRRMAISTPLGDDVLLLRSFSGTESLGRPFEIHADLVSESKDIKATDLIRANVTISVQRPDQSVRHFNGFISRFAFVGLSGSLAQYRATIVPWLWVLTQHATCRVFQEKTIPDIIKQIFADRGFSDYEEHLSGTYEAWEYCVQYRETDFNFISRLMEQEGIYYYFKHEDGKHKLILTDANAAAEAAEGYESVRFRTESQADLEQEVITSWAVEHTHQPDVATLDDFNFLTPANSLAASAATDREDATGNYEIYDFPGEFETSAEAERYAKLRVEELQVGHETIHAESTCYGLVCGGKFTLADHPLDRENREVIITSIHYRGESDEFESKGGGGASNAAFTCSLSAIPPAREFRSPRATPKPVVPGPQTAMVSGKDGEEIWTDEHGRVKVKFPWDRLGKADETSSCWIRVSQSYAGQAWGGMFIPRRGQEVIVEFIDGDPDRPIITGRVYNAAAVPAYPPQEFPTLSYIKTSSSPGGEGFNEIRFEDKSGEEQLFIHAQKNFDLNILNDRFETIGNDRHLEVENNKNEWIKNERHEKVDNHHHEEVGKEYHLKVGDKMAMEVVGERSTTVTGKVTEVYKDEHITEVTKDTSYKAKNIVFEAETKLTLKVGQSSIVIEGSEITIKSGTVKIEGQQKFEAKGLETKIEGTTKLEAKGLQVSIKADVEATVEGAMANLKGSAMTTIKGGIVMIN